MHHFNSLSTSSPPLLVLSPHALQAYTSATTKHDLVPMTETSIADATMSPIELILLIQSAFFALFYGLWLVDFIPMETCRSFMLCCCSGKRVWRMVRLLEGSVMVFCCLCLGKWRECDWFAFGVE